MRTLVDVQFVAVVAILICENYVVCQSLDVCRMYQKGEDPGRRLRSDDGRRLQNHQLPVVSHYVVTERYHSLNCLGTSQSATFQPLGMCFSNKGQSYIQFYETTTPPTSEPPNIIVARRCSYQYSADCGLTCSCTDCTNQCQGQDAKGNYFIKYSLKPDRSVPELGLAQAGCYNEVLGGNQSSSGPGTVSSAPYRTGYSLKTYLWTTAANYNLPPFFPAGIMSV